MYVPLHVCVYIYVSIRCYIYFCNWEVGKASGISVQHELPMTLEQKCSIEGYKQETTAGVSNLQAQEG